MCWRPVPDIGLSLGARTEMNLNGREVGTGALPGEADAFGGLKVGPPKTASLSLLGL